MLFEKVSLFVLLSLGALCIAGCEAPSGGRYNNAVYDAPNYDSIGYGPKYSPEFYNSTYYAGDSFVARPYY
jgi:hypothetical protein